MDLYIICALFGAILGEIFLPFIANLLFIIGLCLTIYLFFIQNNLFKNFKGGKQKCQH